jgi:hypothetical protein
LAPDKVAAVRAGLARAEGLAGTQRREALLQLATELNSDAQAGPAVVADGRPIVGAPGAVVQAKVRTLAATVTELANAARQ